MPEPDILRRLLLMFVTILLVARPLVWGEDTGLVSDFSDASGLALVLLSIIATAAWAGWRLVMKQAVSSVCFCVPRPRAKGASES